MNGSIFWRLVWKEYRQQRALWAAIAVAGLIFQIAVLIYCSLNGVPDVSNRLFTVALSVPILYSLGCGAALFAGEHEAGTFPFQQSLPVTAGRVFLAKFTFAALSALLLFPVLWLLALAMASWRLPDAEWHLQLWGGGLVATIEVLIWALLGSLVLRRVLPAAIVSGVTAVVLGYGSLVLMVAFRDLFDSHANEYFRTLPLRTCFALIALAIAVKFGRHWFDEHAFRWSSPAAQRARSSVATGRPATPTTGITVFTRLVWHEWRQARATMLWCVLGYAVLGTWIIFQQAGPQAYLGLLPVLATIFGASAFAADQRQSQYQFFTEHGVRPRFVWLSRQFVWGCALGMIAAGAALLQLLTWPLASHELHTIGSLLGLSLLLFASGQLCSILIRSGIVAVFTAALCSVLIVSWIVFMLSLGVPWQLSALPLPFFFFWASWLYAPKWIQQRHTRRVQMVTAASIILPLLCVVAATAAYRVYEIPAIELSFDPAVPQPNDSPAARETAAMYQQADDILRRRLTTNSPDDSTEISSRDDEWQKGIDLFVAASLRETCHFYHWDDSDPGNPFDGRQLTRAVLAEAAARVEEGNVEGAAELHTGLLRLVTHFYRQHYETVYRSFGSLVEQELYPNMTSWADQESASPERLQQTLRHFKTWCQENHPDWEKNLIEHHHNVQQFIALDDRIMKNYYKMGDGERVAIRTLGTLFPWERWRMSRLLDVYTETESQGIGEVRGRGTRIAPAAQQSLPWDARLTLNNGKPKLIRSTDVEAWLMTTRWLQMTCSLAAPDFVALDQQLEVRRNALQQQLALVAWRKQHGKLPDSLHQLQGDAFQTLPPDPYTNEPFVYLPKGVEEEVWEYDEMGRGGMEAMEGMSSMMGGMEAMMGAGIAPGKPRVVRSEPFLWSPGRLIRYAPRAQRGPTGSPIASDFCNQNGDVLSDQDLLHQGLRYPIPRAKQQPSDSSAAADGLPQDD